ncbi:unnamed protein product [Dicrocoelium dendriticum]|nr:unnamed protein product [Dicrocoelium dendriticum]
MMNVALCLLTTSKPNGLPYFLEWMLLGVFECLFRWNFVFTGSDLEELKAKELQFYDSLITGDGKYYLCHVEFALPLLATLHHCAIRSCFTVERLLVRTLNSVCATLCSNSTIPESTETVHSSHFSGHDELLYFKRWCLGLLDGNLVPAHKRSEENDDFTSSPNPVECTNKFNLTEFVDWSWPTETKCNRLSSAPASCEYGVVDRSSTIDSIFDLLAPFVFREGDLGWQARDALLLAATYSSRDEEFSYGMANHSSVCPVLATGLATLYAELPRRLVENNLPESWPAFMNALDEQEKSSTKFAEFLNALEFCQSVLEVAHPMLQSSLLHYIHSGFFVSVLGLSLTRSSVEEVATATAYLKQLILRTARSSLLPTLLRFLLTSMPFERPELQSPIADTALTSNLSTALPSDEFEVKTTAVGETYMDLLISRLHSCNTLLGIVTLSLFNAIISLNCEDVMLYLVLRYLVPFRDGLLQQGWVWPESDTFARAAGDFLDLILAYDCSENGSVVHSKSPRTSSVVTSSYGSVAELNLDDEVNPKDVEGDQAFLSPMSDVSGLINGFSGTGLPSTSQLESLQTNGSSTYRTANMCALIPVHSESVTNRKITIGIPGCRDLTLVHAHHSPMHTHSFCAQHELKACVAAEDWLSYVAWAREAIRSRANACSQWRLQFDQQNPTAVQLASFEQYLQKSRQHNGDTTVQSYQALVPEHSLQNLSPFSFLTIHPYARTEIALQAGEEAARSIHLTVSKLDIDAELELDASSPESPPPNKSTNLYLNKETAQQTFFPTRESSVASAHLACRNTNVFSDDLDSADSGCLITDRRPNRISPLYTSLSDYHLSSLSPKTWSNISNVQKIKSWYCLSYTDPDIGRFPTEGDEPPLVPAAEPPPKTNAPVCCRCNSTRDLDMQALQRVSSALDLDTFVGCLDKLDCADLLDHSGRHVQSIELESYFSGSIDPTPRSQHDTAGPIVPLELHDILISGSPQQQQRRLSEQDDARSSIITTTSECWNQRGRHSLRHTPTGQKAHRMACHDSTQDYVNSSSGQFLGALHRRRSCGSKGPPTEMVSNSPKTTIRPIQDSPSHTPFPSLGPFLTTILTRLENLPRNCFYANLLLTNLLSSLAAYPIPLLRAIVLFVPPVAPLGEKASYPNSFKGSALKTLNAACCQLPHAVLSGVRRQLDLFSVQYSVHGKHRVGKAYSFMELVEDAKLYFQACADQRHSPTILNGITLAASSAITDPLKCERQSIFRRVFSRRRKNHGTIGASRIKSDTSITEHSSSANSALPLEFERSSYVSTLSSKPNFQWLPDALPQSTTGMRRLGNHQTQTKRGNRKSASFKREKISWITIQRMVLCAVIFEEFCKELAALCVEHSVHG